MGDPESGLTANLEQVIWGRYLPNKVVDPLTAGARLIGQAREGWNHASDGFPAVWDYWVMLFVMCVKILLDDRWIAIDKGPHKHFERNVFVRFLHSLSPSIC